MEKGRKTKASVMGGVVILLGCCISAFGFHAIYYSGGIGTQADPYLIRTVADWQRLMSEPNDWDKHFLMAADINMAGVTMTPVGNSSKQFTGVFDGGGYVISNVDINLPGVRNVGLFGYLGASGQIKNLGVEDVNISGDSLVGGLAGYIYSSSAYQYTINIENCYSTGSVRAHSFDWRTGTYRPRNYAGGLVGYNYWGIIKSSYAACMVNGASYIGGLVGYNSNGTTMLCYTMGAVSGVYNIGGFVGYSSSGTIKNCFVRGAVNGGSPTGSVVSNIGGFVGCTNDGHISNCYAQGAVTVSGTNYFNIGGFAGYGYTGITKCFWDMETSGQSVGVGSGSSTEVIGKTTAEMKMVSTFANEGWSISDMNGADAEWIILHEGQYYPEITFFAHNVNCVSVPLSGEGTELNPYQIWTAEDFSSLGHYGCTWGKYIRLMADIDLNGTSVFPIGNSIVRFTGNFDGQGFVIRNAAMNLPNKDYVGLFGCVKNGGEVKNLGAEDVNIVGRRYVGGIVGHNSRGTISNCHTSGSIEAITNSSYVGGLAGLSFDGTISDCYSTAKVCGTGATAGGLVGVSLKGTISNCRADGEVKCNDPNNIGSYAGGLTGSNLGTITNSFAAGDVNVISVFSASSAIASAGGLAGNNCGAISNSFARGKVYTSSTSPAATVCLGGLVGLKSDGDVNNCYSEGTIAGDSNSIYYAGGLVGLNFESSVVSSYSRGAVDVNGAEGSGAGGFMGLNLDGNVLDSFWDMQASGKNESEGGAGLETEPMKTQSTFTDAGWDFANVWGICEGTNYPRLLWSIPAADLACPYGVDFADYAFLIGQWFDTDCAANNNCEGADLDFSETVDWKDLKILGESWLDGVSL